ncbi:MAG: nodulation protein NfeD [Methanotrichaceae archaeon]|nr:nodulation protein NfeD [Methanotrichaceae archaeon]
MIDSTSAVGSVLAVDLKDAINPASDDIINDALQEAESGEYQALMIILDTPGGGLDETRSIISQMERTKLPVIGYVYPEGAAAWSAGTLILLGSDIAAMAPHTIIGSAQPVKLSPTGGTEAINDSKIVNAIVALIEEKAKEHDRNATAAREFVVSNLNLNAEEAKQYGVIEYISSSPDDLLHQINGTRVKNATLLTAEAELQHFQPPLNLQFLRFLSDPMIAGLLLIIGLYGIIFGISSPGLGAEVLGIISLSLGLIGLGFNVNLGAIFLILVGMGLILVELHSHSFGILALAGLICVVVGSILFAPTSYPQWYVPAAYQRSLVLALIIPSLILGGFLAFALYKVASIRFWPPASGKIIGEEAEAIDRLDPLGYVLFQGEYWKAETDSIIEPGETVVIIGKKGAVLKVKRKS